MQRGLCPGAGARPVRGKIIRELAGDAPATMSSSEQAMKIAPFHALGIDVGGTKIAAGVVSFPEGRVCTQQVIPTEPWRAGEAGLNDTVRLAEGLCTGGKADGVD